MLRAVVQVAMLAMFYSREDLPLGSACARLPSLDHPRYASGRGGGSAMTFEELLDQAIAMLQRRDRVSYRALQR